MNSRTLKELKISSSEVYTISRRYQSYRNEAKLIIQGQFNPKALRVFQTIFNDYSTNGKMN